MNIKRFNARVRSNRLAELAGDFFLDQESDFIQKFRSKGHGALIGIMRSDGVYTILGENAVHFRTVSGVHGDISHDAFSEFLNTHTIEKGKNHDYQFVPISNENTVWILNEPFMLAFWNTLLYLS